MPPLSVSNVTIKELFSGSAKFGRPSDNTGAGWVATGDKGIATIQKQVSQDGSIVYVARWTNYMRVDGMNGRILPGLPILRQHDSVYFKTSSTTTRGIRRKAPFCFKFETVEEAEEFEMWWLLKNGSIASWKKEDTQKKLGGNSLVNNNLPLQETTNASVNVNVNDKLKSTVAHSGLKSIAEDSINNSNEEDVIDLNGNNSKDLKDDNGSLSDDDDSSNDYPGEGVIIDDEDAPQSQNWKTAFAPY